METLKNNQRPKYWQTNRSLKSVRLSIVRWFDKVNGNSYFAAEVIVNDRYRIAIPYQYGYGPHPEAVAAEYMRAYGLVSGHRFESIASACERCGVFQRGGLSISDKDGRKRELLAIGGA